MKRTITLSLVALLIISSILLLAACGGSGMNEQEWNDAMDYIQNCDTITISFQQEKSANARITKSYETHTVTYDKTNKMLYAAQEVKTYNIFDVLTEHTSKFQYVEIMGVEVRTYTKNTKSNTPASWNANFRSYNSEDAALEVLHQTLLSYLKMFSLDSFNYNDFTFKKGKYEKSAVVNDKNTLWQLTFSDGKLSNASYETKHKKGSSDIDYSKISVTLTYSAVIEKPNDLPF